MKSLTAIAQIIVLFLTLPSCMTANRLRYTAAKSSASRGVNHALVAKAGWKVGQVYKTMKPGGVIDSCRLFYLEAPATNSYVETALSGSSQRPPTVQRIVPTGTLFQVVSIKTSGAFEYFQFVKARQITGTADPRIVDITFFRGKTFNEEVNGEEYGNMRKRDSAYLVPVHDQHGVTHSSAE